MHFSAPIRALLGVPLLLATLSACSPEFTPESGITPLYGEGDLAEHCSFHLDESATRDIRDVVKKDDLHWQLPGFKELSFGWRRSAVFIKCAVGFDEPATHKRVVLLEWPVMDSWQIAYQAETGIAFDETGDYLPYSKRYKPEHFTYHMPVSLPAAEVNYIYMRFKSDKPIALPLSIYTNEGFLERLTVWRSIVWGMMTPLLFCLVLNIFMYITLRDHRFRPYIGFLVFFTLFVVSITGIGTQYIYGEIPWMNDKIMGTTGGLFTTFICWFGLAWFKGIGRALLPIQIVSYVGIMAACIGIFDVFYSTTLASGNGIAVLVLATPSVLYAVFIRKWHEGVMWFFGISIFCYAMLFWLALLFGFMPPHIIIYGSAVYGAIACSLILTLVIPVQVGRLKQEMQGLNAELNDSLDQVNALHEKQKGDYMLTSYLLHPFQRKGADSPAVSTDFYIRQYKQFSFRERESEIGGDLCLTDRFELGGKPYTFFVNGDAMGKSLQGAGGAVVLGAAIQSQLSQTRAGKIRTFIPELWLRDVYEDLHELFLSFEGSMLMSFVMGLVDEEQGVLYFINTEHPWTVLFREKHAAFLEDTLTTRKLGTPTEDGLLTVRIIELMDDDKIVVGSDGRDDIYLQNEGEPKLNEDENLFLKWVSMGDGNAEDIAEAIQMNSQLKDDLSILTVHYHKQKFAFRLPDNIAALLNESEKDQLKKCTNKKIYCRTLNGFAAQAETGGDLALANTIRWQIYDFMPMDIKNIRRLSAGLTRLKDYNTARRFTDLIVARNPGSPKALLNSAMLYRRLGKLPYAKRLATIALELNPKLEQASEILNT